MAGDELSKIAENPGHLLASQMMISLKDETLCHGWWVERKRLNR